MFHLSDAARHRTELDSQEGSRHSANASLSTDQQPGLISGPSQFYIGEERDTESPIHPNNRQVISRSVRATVDDETRNAAFTKPQVIGAAAAHSDRSDSNSDMSGRRDRSHSSRRLTSSAADVQPRAPSLEPDAGASVKPIENRSRRTPTKPPLSRTHSQMGDSPRSAESERRQQVFSEAELRILHAGREVAEQKEKLAKAEALLQQREQAQAVTWTKLQERVVQEEDTMERRKRAVASRELATNQTAQVV